MPTQGAPSPRFSIAAAWNGAQMITWGDSNFTDWQANRNVFDAGTASWVGATATSGAPSPREGATGVWTGSEFLVWGGWTGGPYENTGALLAGAGAGQEGAWTATSISGAPSPRFDHVGVWTGKALLIWGGCGGDGCASLAGDGGRFYLQGRRELDLDRGAGRALSAARRDRRRRRIVDPRLGRPRRREEAARHRGRIGAVIRGAPRA